MSSEVKIEIFIYHEHPYTILDRKGEFHFKLVPSVKTPGTMRVRYTYKYPHKERDAVTQDRRRLKNVDVKDGTFEHDVASGFFKVSEVDAAMGKFIMAHVTEAIETSREALKNLALIRRHNKQERIVSDRVSKTITVNGTVFVNGRVIEWPAMESCTKEIAAHMMRLIATSWATSMGLETIPKMPRIVEIPDTLGCMNRQKKTLVSAHETASRRTLNI